MIKINGIKIFNNGAAGFAMDIEEFTEYADQVVNEEVPSPLLKNLHMGIIVLPETMQEEEENEEDVQYIMGEYLSNEMGNHIVLYYGSFAEVLQGASRETWLKEIRETIKHEVWHHVEAMAGDEKLARQELIEQEKWSRMKKENDSVFSRGEQSKGWKAKVQEWWKRLRY